MDIRRFFGSPTTTKSTSSGKSQQSQQKSPVKKTDNKDTTKTKKGETNNNNKEEQRAPLKEKSARNGKKNSDGSLDSKDLPSKNSDIGVKHHRKDSNKTHSQKPVEESLPNHDEKTEKRSKKEEKSKSVDKPQSKSKQKKEEKLQKSAEKKKKDSAEDKDKKSISDELFSDDKPPESAEKKKKTRKKVSSDEEEFEEISRSKKKKSKSQSKKALVILDSESEEDEEPVPKKAKTKSKRRSQVTYVCDSDEEPQQSIKSAFARCSTTPKKIGQAKTKEDKTKPQNKAVSVADFFGGGSVHQSERKTSSAKRKAEETVSVDESLEMHDDEEFEKTLLQLDMQEPQTKKPRKENEDDDLPIPATPPVKFSSSKKTEASALSPSKTSSKSSRDNLEPSKTEKSLSSKLADRAKANTTVVKETPEKKMPTPSGKKISPAFPGKKSPVSSFSPGKKSPVSSSPGKKSPASSSPGKKIPSAHTSPQEASGSTETPTMEKKHSSYRSYLNREGPRALGSKEIPEGAENCLEGMTFVLSGVYESIERDEAKSLIEKHGGKVTGSISKKTTYIVAGRDAGESKLAKAEQFGTTQLDEDGLFTLIRTAPGKKSKYTIAAEQQAAREKLQSSYKAPLNSPSRVTKSSAATTPTSQRTPVSSRSAQSPASVSSAPSTPSTSQTKPSSSPVKKSIQSGETLLWVDKYKPPGMKQIIGQQGDKSNARKLHKWLLEWHKNQAMGKKPAFNRFSDDGSGYKAALLSGPPGVGKTTTAQLVCKEAGFTYVELNASDTRSKKSLQTEVMEALNNHTLMDYMGKKTSGSHPDGSRHCLIMDEVDGMAGNEDRGGIQELIQLIKQSKIPIITMCNDRNHQKMRSLSNYCFDLRFQRPRVEQIKAAMMSIAFKEGLKIPPPALNEIIVGANQDVRQILHNMEMWCKKEKGVTYEQAQKDAKSAKKDIKMGPFDVGRKVFVGGEETAKMSINDKADLFFHDYSLAPLFVQENYIYVTPYAARGDVKKHLDLLSKTADSICDGDLVDRKVRGKGNWSLLPTQAIFASVIPGDTMRGSIGQMVAFPSWLGKNSTTNKVDRILQELKTHMRLKVSANKASLNMEYLPHVRSHLTRPLLEEGSGGVSKVISIMDEYDIIKDDYDNILEITQWPNRKDPMSMVESKVKAAFTRTYNKESHMTPYSIGAAPKKKRTAASTTDELGELEGEGGTVADSGDESSDDINNDGMIKKKKQQKADKGKEKAKPKGKVSTAKPRTGGKGRGKKS